MIRISLLVLLVAPMLVAAAPARLSEKEQIEQLWGKIVTPSDQCEFKLDGKSLTIRTDGAPVHGLIDDLGGQNRCKMPRVTRTVKGDFEMTVKLTDAAAPNRDEKHQDAWPTTRAGLFISGGGYAIEFLLTQYYTKVNGVLTDQLTRGIWVDTWFPRGGSGSTLAKADANKPTYLRITRKEKTVSVSYSFDGKEWSVPFTPRQELDFSDELTVGVFVSHSTHQIVEATFAEFTIQKPAKVEKK